MKKLTKIVATIGPATESDKMIRETLAAGVNVPRFNVKHNEPSWHSQTIDKYREIANELDINIGILVDLQGPSIRIGDINENGIELNKGDEVILGVNNAEDIVLIPFPQINYIKSIEIDSLIKIQDGIFTLSVTEFKAGEYIKARVISGGKLLGNKNVNIPHAKFNLPSFTEKDKQYIQMAVEKKVDYIALSFVRNKEDINNLKSYITELGGDQKIITKFETQEAIDNIDDIIKYSDAIMIARGDLGIETPFETVPRIQRTLIKKSRENKKPVIVATQMMKSMLNSPIPSRAEVSDITLAVLNKADAIMLSEESSIGKYSTEAIESMARIAKHNEPFNDLDINLEIEFESIQDTLANAVSEILTNKNSEYEFNAVMIFTISGDTARAISRLGVYSTIYAFSDNDRTVGSLTLSRGVYPYKIDFGQNPIDNIKVAIDILKKENKLIAGNKVLIMFGDRAGILGASNTITVQQI